MLVSPSMPDVTRIRSHDGVGVSGFWDHVSASVAYIGGPLRTRSRNTPVSDYGPISAFSRTVQENHL